MFHVPNLDGRLTEENDPRSIYSGGTWSIWESFPRRAASCQFAPAQPNVTDPKRLISFKLLDSKSVKLGLETPHTAMQPTFGNSTPSFLRAQ
jgi:hypothetical protein